MRDAQHAAMASEQESVMTLADMLLPDLDHEAAVTRLLIERVPESRLWWTPHPKSWTLADLCLHLAQLPLWSGDRHGTDVLRPQPSPRPSVSRGRTSSLGPPRSSASTRTSPRVDARSRGATDAAFLTRWTLLHAGRTLFTMPRVSVLRSLVLGH